MTEAGTRAPDRFKLSRLRSGFSSWDDNPKTSLLNPNRGPVRRPSKRQAWLVTRRMLLVKNVLEEHVASSVA